MLDFIERHDVTDDYGNVLYNVTAVSTPPVSRLGYTYVTPPPIKIDNTPTPARYGIPTSTDRIDALTAQVDDLRKQQAAITRQLREISEQLQARPFPMAEDAWSTGG